MANMNQEQMVTELSTWSVMEVAGLVKALEEKWGVSAAPVAVAGAAAGAPAAAPAEEQTEFDVELTECATVSEEPRDRHPEEVLRQVPSERTSPGRAPGCRPPGVFRSVFPIKDFNGTSELVFVRTPRAPKYDVDECRQRGMTFAAPIKVTIQLIIYDSAPTAASASSATSRSRRSTSARSR
jgi:hypothetical protein